MRVTTISSYKGGVGKSVTAFNLSYNLAASSSKVLAIDCDPQGDLTYLCQRSMISRTIYDLFQDGKINSCVYRSRFPNLDILASDSRAEEINGDNPYVLNQALEQVKDKYDYVIIDCHPSMQLTTINAICASDDIIVPLKPNRFERNGLEMMDSYISQLKELNPKLRFLGILFTMYAGRKSQKCIIEDILGKTRYPIWDTVISTGEAVNTSLDYRKPLIMHRKGDKVTNDYRDLTEEYIRSAI